MTKAEAAGCRDRKTLAIENDADFVQEIADFMEALGHPQRLKILKAIEKEPKEIRQIAEDTGMTYENTKKHLRRLLATGLVNREAGFGQPTTRGMLPVWKYSLSTDVATMIIRNLGVLSTIRSALTDTLISQRIDEIRSSVARFLTGSETALVVICGPQDGRVFPLTVPRVALGREDDTHRAADKNPSYLTLLPDHVSVTRISHPHAIVSREKGKWFVTDTGSTSGTAVNGDPLTAGTPVSLHSGDVIELGKGVTSAWVVLIILSAEE
ncbi:MAG: FHA domain-containing protein [Methanomicrobiales archaeon]|nr:FHA domain-containing protein [Methanomicrobiales archaeon]